MQDQRGVSNDLYSKQIDSFRGRKISELGKLKANGPPYENSFKVKRIGSDIRREHPIASKETNETSLLENNRQRLLSSDTAMNSKEYPFKKGTNNLTMLATQSTSFNQ